MLVHLRLNSKTLTTFATSSIGKSPEHVAAFRTHGRWVFSRVALLFKQAVPALGELPLDHLLAFWTLPRLAG